MADEPVPQQLDDRQNALPGDTQAFIPSGMSLPMQVTAPDGALQGEAGQAALGQAEPIAAGQVDPAALEQAAPVMPGQAAQAELYPDDLSATAEPLPSDLAGTAEIMMAADSATQNALSAFAQPAGEDPVQIRAITVRTGRLVCDVVISNPRFRYCTPRLSAFASGQYPDLPHHACVNEKGNTFAYVMEKTSTPHLLEHVIISEQVRSQGAGSTLFMGTTEWVDENVGLARIEVGFRDDLVALRAFNDATRFLNMAVLTCLA